MYDPNITPTEIPAHCFQVHLLDGYMKGTLTVEDATAFFEHLPTCFRCKGAMRLMPQVKPFKRVLVQPVNANLKLMMESAKLTDDEWENAVSFEKHHSVSTAVDYILVCLDKRQRAA